MYDCIIQGSALCKTFLNVQNVRTIAGNNTLLKICNIGFSQVL